VIKYIVETLTIILLSFILGFSYNYLSKNPLSIFSFNDKSVELKNIVEIDSDLVDYYINDPNAIIIDARIKTEYINSHIKNAINIPVNEFDKLYQVYKNHIESKEVIIVYCSSENCDDSLNLAKKIVKKLNKTILLYKNGFREWNSLNKDVEYGEGN